MCVGCVTWMWKILTTQRRHFCGDRTTTNIQFVPRNLINCNFIIVWHEFMNGTKYRGSIVGLGVVLYIHGKQINCSTVIRIRREQILL